MNTISTLVFRGEVLNLVEDRYKDNGRLAISVVTASGAPFATLSCNVKSEELPDADCFFVKDYSENAELARACLEADLFEVVAGRKVLVGYVEVPTWRIRRYVWVVYDPIEEIAAAFRSRVQADRHVAERQMGAATRVMMARLL